MTRTLLPYPNMTNHPGIEGLLQYSNESMNNLPVPLFLLVFYALGLYIMITKTEWKTGVCTLFVSFLFFIIGMIAQTYTSFNQIVMFIFALGMGVGVVISFIENAK